MAEVEIKIDTAALLRRVDKEAMGALDEGRKAIVKKAMALAPYRTGKLKRSIKSKRKGLRVHVYTENGTGGFVEGGTVVDRTKSGSPTVAKAQPFLRPAFEAKKSVILNRMKDRL